MNLRGIYFNVLLTFLFITLKLTNIISWSWWLVVSPLWIPPVLFLIALIGLVTFLWYC